MKRTPLRRLTPLRATSTLERTTRLRPRNAKRSLANWKRAYGSEERVQMISRMPCLLCGSTPSQNAHVETGGKGRKADASTVIPLCAACHMEHHTQGFVTMKIGDEAGRVIPKEELLACAAFLDQQWKKLNGESA